MTEPNQPTRRPRRRRSGRPTRSKTHPSTIRQHSAGGVVFRRDPAAGLQFLLIQNSFDHRWAIPKGTLEPGETSEVAAVREIQEETGVRTEIRESLGSIKYYYQRDGQRYRKQLDIYLMAAIGGTELDPAKFDPVEGMVAHAEWLEPAAAAAKIDYNNTRKLLRQAKQILTS